MLNPTPGIRDRRSDRDHAPNHSAGARTNPAMNFQSGGYGDGADWRPPQRESAPRRISATTGWTCPPQTGIKRNGHVRSRNAGMLPIFHQAIGSVLVVTGLIVLPLPLPFGLIMITIGMALLAPYVPLVQRSVKRMRKKWPTVDNTLRQYRDRLPPIIRATIDKTDPRRTPAE